MSAIYQGVWQTTLEKRLASTAPNAKVWPRLLSSDQSLNNQPAAASLERSLASRQQIILAGPAGSGKTVLSLYLAVNGKNTDFAYLEAQRWMPTSSQTLLMDFLTTAGCDITKAKHALDLQRLVLILDAIDEAPWRAGGTSLSDALASLSEEIAGKAGLLVTSRTLEAVPAFESMTSTAALGGIHPDDLEAFLIPYVGSRSGVSALVESLLNMPFREEIKYSPLILRRLAEGLSVKGEPKNLVELFEQMADSHINRECTKPVGVPATGSWQAAYAQEPKHRNLVNALVFGSPRQGHTIAEEAFRRVVQEMLQPAVLGARALVELSTLMAEHPLVSVQYKPDEIGRDAYLVTCSHDWVRAALFPKFLTDQCFESQVYVAETWQDGLPHPEDFAPAWDYLSDRGPAAVEALMELVSTSAQAESLARWLLAQLFSSEVSTEAKSLLYSALATTAHRIVPRHSSIIDILDISEIVTGPLLIERTELKLNQVNQCGNLSGVTFDSVEILVEGSGPSFLTFWNSRFRGSRLVVQNAASITLVGCFFESLEIVSEGAALIELDGCAYDPENCVFPPTAAGLESCTPVDVAKILLHSFALVEVLRRLVVRVIPGQPEQARKKANVGEHNIYTGLVRDIKSTAETVVNVMVLLGFVVRKPTGGVKRIDPTTTFDACEAARFIMKPNIEGRGPMTAAILGKLTGSQ